MIDRVFSDTALGFSNTADRLTYLLSQYKIPVSLSVFAGTVLLASGRWRLPDAPGWLTEALIPVIILAIPTYAVWRSISQRIVDRNLVTVIEYGGPQSDPSVWRIPPKTWNDRTVEGNVDAHRPDSGSVWKAHSVEYLEDVSELRVRGVWTDLAAPGQLYSSQKKFDAIYTDMTQKIIQSSALESRISEAGVEMFDSALISHLEMSENGRLPDGTRPMEIIEDLKQDVEDHSIDIEDIGAEPDERDRIDERDNTEPTDNTDGDI